MPAFPLLAAFPWGDLDFGKEGIQGSRAKGCLHSQRCLAFSEHESPTGALAVQTPGSRAPEWIQWVCSEVRECTIFTGRPNDSTAEDRQTAFWETSFQAIIPILQKAQKAQPTWLNVVERGSLQGLGLTRGFPGLILLVLPRLDP